MVIITPKDDLILYAVDNKTGKKYELGEITEFKENSEPLDLFDDELVCRINKTYSVTGTFTCASDLRRPKVRMHLYGISNNWIRMHGGKPMRTLPRRFMR